MVLSSSVFDRGNTLGLFKLLALALKFVHLHRPKLAGRNFHFETLT